MLDLSGLPEPIEGVADGDLFALLKCGDGAVYALRCKEDKTVALFKDDDLAAFLAEYEAVKASYPTYSSDQVLAQLWDQGGYSWVAVPDEMGA